MRVPLICVWLGALACLARAPAAWGQDMAPEDRRTHLVAEFQDLRHLVEFCSQIRAVPIVWERGQIQGELRVQPGQTLTDEGLWQFTISALARKELAIVQSPGSNALQVVAADKAARLARLERADLGGASAGFLKVLVCLEEIPAEQAKGAISRVLSAKGSEVEVIADAGALLIADYEPQLRQALDLLSRIDVPGVAPAVVEVPLSRADPATLTALLGQIHAKEELVSDSKLRGELLPIAAAGSVLIIAPPGELEHWRDRVSRFDREQPVVTEHYTPQRFGLSETASLIEEVVHGDEGVLADDAWKLVQDKLTGTLILTTTPAKQREVAALLARLESASPDARRPMRTYPIRNRQVSEVLELLQRLIDDGAIAGGVGTDSPIEAAQGATAPLSQSRSETLKVDDSVTLTADEGTNRLIAFGDARLLDQLEPLVETLDVQEAQVAVEALVVQLNETQLRDLGVELQRIGVSDGLNYGVASLFGLSGVEPSMSSLAPAGGSGLTAAVLDPGDFSAVLRAIEEVTGGETRTMPRMVVNNNETATLDSVLETPFTSTNASNTVATTTLGGTSEAGTQVSVKPQVAAGDSVVVDYDVSLSGFVGQAADPSLPPPKQLTRLKSVVTVPDGFTVVVGGIEQEIETESTSRVPVLGQLPLIGQLFSSDRVNRSKSRFFVFLRCNVMRSSTFEDLKYLSRASMQEADVDDGWPRLKPRVIR